MFNMSRYNEKEADLLDKLIRSVLMAAAERIIISKKQSGVLLGRIKNKANNNKLKG